MLKAVEAYKPAKDEREDHDLLLDYLRMRNSEEALWDEVSPEDIPF